MSLAISISRFTPNYCEAELRVIARWIEAGDSGKVVGLAGSGKSTLLKFMCQYPESVTCHFVNLTQSVVLVPADLNDLAAFDLATFFRTILRSIYENQTRFPTETQQLISQKFETCWQVNDPFVVQSALRTLLFCLKEKHVRLVLILDRFDTFCEGRAPPEMFDTLRGLRDSFQDNLCYIVGLRYELSYLPNIEVLGELLDLFDTHTCWVGALSPEDAVHLIHYETERLGLRLTHSEEQCFLELSGRYPLLLKAICRWWRSSFQKPSLHHLIEPLMDQLAVQVRLKALWAGLTQEEQHWISELAVAPTESKDGRKYRSFAGEDETILKLLSQKGICRLINGRWEVNGQLLKRYALEKRNQGLGRISYDRETQVFWQGIKRLELSQQQQVAMEFLLTYPHQRLTKTDFMMALWPDEWEEVDESRLYQLIRQLRLKIEPHPARPVYLVNWRNLPEGGYQFFPEGRAIMGRNDIGINSAGNL